MYILQKSNSTLGWLCFLSFILISSASSLETVCGSIKKLGSCKAVISVLTLAIKTCKEKFFKLIPCKTRYGGRYPCGVSWKGIKYCDGWICVPGTVPTTISVPCGVNVGSKKLDFCDVARKGVPNLDEITRLAAGYCKCLPEAFDFIDLDTAKSAITSLDTGAATYSILSKYGSLEQVRSISLWGETTPTNNSECLVENALNVQDNKDGLSTGSGALVQSANTKIFTAAEVHILAKTLSKCLPSQIDLARYREFASALASCFVGDCDSQAVRAWFLDYLTDSEKVMGEQLKGFLSPWQSAFEEIGASLDSVGGDIGNIEEQFGTINQSISQITSDFCSNITSCAETTVSKLRTKVDETIQTSQALIGLQATLMTTITNAQDLYKIISDAIIAFDTLSDLDIDTIVEKVISGEIQIEAIVSGSWLGDAQADANSAAAAEDAVRKIQTLFQNGIVSHVTFISTGETSMISSLESITSGGSPSIQAIRVASYQRWSKGYFSMPCLTTGKITLKLGGFSQQVDYPKFYRCEQNYRIPFPNHHIPYIKISFGTAVRIRATLVRMAADSGNDALSEDNTPQIPTASEADWPYTPEAADNGPPLETAALAEYNPTATEIALEPERTAFTMPPDLYQKAEEVPAQTTPPSSLVFFTTTDANGAPITASTALADGTALEIMTTQVAEGTETGGVDEATPGGYEEGSLAPSTITLGPTATATNTGKNAKATSKKSAACVVGTITYAPFLVMAMFVLFC
ncbi:hypothetical protein BKA65DRAFT_540909 [Rhexocercosporidium sp. MPI-PUGE-AT-0058]|nr:hypothetical protein BKA65DRAFT_540909 [Rhexocercosporidium sp. MPI-PUGE-AT-0058]